MNKDDIQFCFDMYKYSNLTTKFIAEIEKFAIDNKLPLEIVATRTMASMLHSGATVFSEDWIEDICKTTQKMKEIIHNDSRND